MSKNLDPQFKIVIIYMIVGALWIYFSDHMIAALFNSTAAITFAQSIKGLAFITVTGSILFVLVKKDFDALKRANQEVVEGYEQTIFGWVQLMDLRHNETKHHTERVTRMTVELAKLMGITDRELKHIERGAILHDIGKIGIPDAILIKPERLKEEEWAQMKLHPVIGRDLISKIKFLKESLDIPYCHHEKWNGEGYPQGLAGEAIPLAARIFAVIDIWDALSHPRVYKSAWPEDQVIRYLKAEAGQHFDPAIVAVFLANFDQIKAKGHIDEQPPSLASLTLPSA